MTILLIVAGILLSSVPIVLAYIRFRNLKDEAAYKDLMTKAMIVGLLSCPAGFLLPGVFAIIERVFHINEMGLLGAAYHKIILLALAEEIVKTFLFSALPRNTAIRIPGWISLRSAQRWPSVLRSVNPWSCLEMARSSC